MRIIEDTEHGILYDIVDELTDTIDRAKYYNEPLGKEVAEKVMIKLQQVLDGLTTNGCDTCSARFLDQHICKLPEQREYDMLETDLRNAEQTIESLEKSLESKEGNQL